MANGRVRYLLIRGQSSPDPNKEIYESEISDSDIFDDVRYT
jgi:hypothetical protein